MTTRSLVPFAALIFAAFAPSVRADAPPTIGFQGQLKDAAGHAITSPVEGTSVVFSLYTDPTGGESVWTETQSLPVTAGLFTASLGSVTSFASANVAFDKPYWIGVKVADEADDMTPRLPLQSVPYALGAKDAGAWSLSGNSGTNSATDFLGTTDTAPLVFKANGHRVAQYEDAASADNSLRSVNVLVGSEYNTIAAGVVGGTISGGGGINGLANTVSGNFSVIGGGTSNIAYLHPYVTIAGGYNNIVGGDYSSIAGGSGNNAQGTASVVAGGYQNGAVGDESAVAGGYVNQAIGAESAVGGGRQNAAIGYGSVVSGGASNTAPGYGATVAGGVYNYADGQYSSIGGGDFSYASGAYSTVPGGWLNVANGTASFAAGYKADANKDGSFVWSDYSADQYMVAPAANEFCVRAKGGIVVESFGNVSVYTGVGSTEANRYVQLLNSPNAPSASGLKAGGILCADNYGYANPGKNDMVVKGSVGIGYNFAPTNYALAVNGSVYALNGYTSSDRRLKSNIQTVNNALDDVVGLRGVTFDWNKEAAPDRRFPDGRQVGLIAQEVETVLPELVSEDGQGFKAVNYQGVVPVLVEAVKTLKERNDALQARLDALTATVSRLQKGRGR